MIGAPDERSPDAILSDGTDDTAIEIKQLTDGESFHTYHHSIQSLNEQLAPDPTRRYVLFPPPSIRLPLDRQWVKRVRSRIAIAAPALRIGDAVELSIPRRAIVRFLGPSDVGIVFCEHARSEKVSAVSPEVKGCFVLEDSGEPDHQFLTEKRRLAFQRALRRACAESERSGQAAIEWCEEWRLLRDQDPTEGKGGMLVIAIVADFLESAAIESVQKEIQGARKKFEAKRWAGRTAVALHAGEQQQELTPTLFESAIAGLEADAVQPLDLVFLVVSAQVHQFDFTRWSTLGDSNSARIAALRRF